MKVQTLLLVSFYFHLSIGMPQIQRPSPRENMVGGFKPSTPILNRNRNGRRFKQNRRMRQGGLIFLQMYSLFPELISLTF